MPLEIEAKFKIADPEAMRRKLLEAGAEPAGGVLEENTYFDLPGEPLRRSDRGVRIRVSRRPDGGQWAVLTAKGPRRPGELKVRSEAEVGVDSAEAAAAVLESLGYERVLAFQKRRQTFRFDQAEVVLDELPELGFFLEIEAADEATVQRARASLGLADRPVIQTPYVALVADHLGAAGGARRLDF